MNTIEQGALIAGVAFIFSTIFSYYNEGKVSWRISVWTAAGFLIGTFLLYLVRHE